MHKIMVRYWDDMTPRSDGKKGKPTCVTVDKLYEVVLEDETHYRIINDKGNRSRYCKARFRSPIEFNFRKIG